LNWGVKPIAPEPLPVCNSDCLHTPSSHKVTRSDERVIVPFFPLFCIFSRSGQEAFLKPGLVAKGQMETKRAKKGKKSKKIWSFAFFALFALFVSPLYSDERKIGCFD
jgi:hypothetical protein